MVKAVIFDRDGVLLDSEFANVRAAELVFRDFGVRLTAKDKAWIVGRHPDDYLVPFVKRFKIDVAKFKELQRKRYYEVIESTALFENTINLVKDLHRHGIPLAICTSASRAGTLKILSGIGIADLFTEIVTSEDYSQRKPNPEPYLVTAQKLHLKPKDCLVIEDSGIGLQAAINAGMRCVVIYNEYTHHHDFTGAIRVLDAHHHLKAEDLFDL